MSRVANAPVVVPSGVEIKINDNVLFVKGTLGELSFNLHHAVEVEIDSSFIRIKASKVKNATAFAGTTRAQIQNMVKGVSEGFVKKMQLVGVGYRAQIKADHLSLSLGYSNPIEYLVPNGIIIDAPSQTELLVKGIDKQKVGQVTSEIRAFRPPEPYKGKGVRLADEFVQRKEAKKK
ncbi:MAG: 50S ribosomal protein L6 [Methylomonas sp.]|nr:50S ribosomal protein L6 [Methylomonas sp.]PPD36677.1 MAG: 50S ribosomal protein L6 [Methylomonas sp.]PPD52262.1 MAG: 50S ribosomal protein L6 [Methylotenera sp.]